MSWNSTLESRMDHRARRPGAFRRSAAPRWLRACLACFAVLVLFAAGAFEAVCASAAVVPMPATVRPLSHGAELDKSDFDMWRFVPCWDDTPCGKGHCWQGVCAEDGHCVAYWNCA